jgi:pSer/pThr/pTyr-binding forkhead associated (FHA) protein
MEAHFLLTPPEGKIKKFKLKHSEFIIIGREGTGCHVQTHDDMCSSTHCKLSLTRNFAAVEDLESKNGVSINGTKINKKESFFIGDLIKIGDTTIRINIEKMTPESVKSLTYNPKIGRGKILRIEKKRQKVKETTKILSRQNATKRIQEESINNISLKTLKLLNLGAYITDFVISLLLFVFLSKIIMRLIPTLRELRLEMGTDKLFYHDEMLIYHGLSLFISAIAYIINRKMPSGSIGEKIFTFKK